MALAERNDLQVTPIISMETALAMHEYNAALDMDPNRAVSLHGRGLAKIALGDARSGRLDQAAALTLNPDVARDFASYGL